MSDGENWAGAIILLSVIALSSFGLVTVASNQSAETVLLGNQLGDIMVKQQWGRCLVGYFDPNNAVDMAAHIANLTASQTKDVYQSCGRWQISDGSIATSGAYGGGFAYQNSDADLNLYISSLAAAGIRTHLWVESDAAGTLDITDPAIYAASIASVTTLLNRFPTAYGFHDDCEDLNLTVPATTIAWYNACADAAHNLGKYYTCATNYQTWQTNVYPSITKPDCNLIMMYDIFTDPQCDTLYYNMTNLPAVPGCKFRVGFAVGLLPECDQSLTDTLADITHLIETYPNSQYAGTVGWQTSTFSNANSYDGLDDWVTYGLWNDQIAIPPTPPTPPEEPVPELVPPIAAANSIMRQNIAAMALANVGDYCFEAGCVEPGIDNVNTIMRRNLARMQ